MADEMCRRIAPARFAVLTPPDEDGRMRTPWCHRRAGHDGPHICGDLKWDEDGRMRTPWCHRRAGHDGPHICGDLKWEEAGQQQSAVVCVTRTVEVENVDSEHKIRLAARVAHEINRVFCTALGDNSQSSWSDAPAWQQDSAVAGVRALVANPGSTAAQSHARWLEHKTREGWKYGLVKNTERKEHPCMVPYDQLPSEQRVKDHLFCAVVRSVFGLPENAALPSEKVSCLPTQLDRLTLQLHESLEKATRKLYEACLGIVGAAYVGEGKVICPPALVPHMREISAALMQAQPLMTPLDVAGMLCETKPSDSK